MAFYMIQYSIGKNNEYVYPSIIAEVVWKTVVYHFTEKLMIGETDAAIKADGKAVISLKPDDAKKRIEEYQSSYPKPKQDWEDSIYLTSQKK